MNCQVDVIVIGDSKSGKEALKAIAANNPAIKIAFISREFKSNTTRDFLNVEYIKEEVVFTDYKNRLFGCYLKSGDRIYCTHLIIASGLKYAPLVIGNEQIPNVFHNTDDIPKSARHQPAIVIGKDSNTDIKFALTLAKKYKQVYFCYKDVVFSNVSKSNLNKLFETKNIVTLLNANLKKVSDKVEGFCIAELDNYSTVTYSALYAKTTAEPDVAFVSSKIITKDSGYLVTNHSSESLLVPKCYAIGECTKKSTKKMLQLMVEDILNDFKGGY